MTTDDARKLFVAGLSDSISEEVLRQLFEATGGEVVEVSLPRDRATGNARGFGFVTLATGDQAEAARESLDGSFQGGRSISVRTFQSGSPRREPRSEAGVGPAEDRTLYVGNLPYDATVAEVEEILSSVGVTPVLRVHLPLGPDGRPRGFGFVTLSSPPAVQQAVDAMATADLRGRRVMVKVAHPRGSAPPGGPAGRFPSTGPRYSDSPSGYDGGGPPRPSFRTPEPGRTDGGGGEEEEGEVAPGIGRPSKDKRRKGVGGPVANKRANAGVGDARRERGGGSSWQRWEEKDEKDDKEDKDD